MGSYQPRVLEGGRSVVNLLSLVFFAAYCQWHNIILAEWLHSTDIRAQSQSSDFWFWWYWPVSEQTNIPDVSSLQSGLVTARGDAGMHGGSIIGGGGYCGQARLTIHFSSQWPHTFAFITSLSRHNTIGARLNKWQVTPINIGTAIKYWTVMALFRSVSLRYLSSYAALWFLIHILFAQWSGRISG